MWFLVAAQSSDHPLLWYLLAMVGVLIGVSSGIIALVQFVAHERADGDHEDDPKVSSSTEFARFFVACSPPLLRVAIGRLRLIADKETLHILLI